MAPQEVLLDKYYELDNIRAKLPQVVIDEIISVLQQTYGLGSVNYKEDRFETKLSNGKMLPQVHIVMKSASQSPVAILNRDPINCSSIAQIHAENNDTMQKYLRKIESGEGLDPL